MHAQLILSQDIVIDCTRDSSELIQLLPAKFFVKSIDIQADFTVDKDELFYLIDLVANSHITIQELERTLFYLRKKESFSAIEVMYNPSEEKLIFKLEGLFILTHVRLHGSMIGKEKYKSSYVLEAGEYFDEKKHAYSVKKIQEKLHRSGSLQAKVTDKVVYNSVHKTVHADLFLQKNQQFFIGNCNFDIANIDRISQEDLAVIQNQLQRIFLKKFFSVKYNKDVIEKTVEQLKHYLHKHGFSQVLVNCKESIDHLHHQVDLTFDISFEEKKEIVFWGNHFFTQDHFLENILMYGSSSWHFPGAILSDEIESLYKNKGFWDVQVSIKEEPNKTFCIIDEGRRAIIKSIEIKDNFNIPTQQIVTECCKQIQDKPFDRDVFTQAIFNLKQLYARQGFWDIKVVKEEFIKLPLHQDAYHDNNYKIILTLDEGISRKLQSVDIVGYQELLSQGPFLQLSSLKTSLPFNRSWIVTQKNWLLHYFHDAGYHKVLVDYHLTGTFDAMNIIWTVHLDKEQVHFGKFIVSGNSRIPFKFLQRELCIEQGQVWDKKKIEKSLANLRSLELFDTAHVYAYKQIDEQGHIPVGVKLIEADKYEMRARIGCQQVGKDFSLQQGFSYKVGGTAIVNNPFKFGDRAIIEADFTRFYENFSMQYLMPWLFKRPIRSQIKLYDNHYLQPLFIGSDISIYNAFQQGVLFGLQEKHEHINLGMSIGLEFKGVSKANIADIGISIDYNPLLFEKKFAYFFAQPSLMWTNVDNIVNPKSGNSALISFLAMADLQNQTSLFKCIGEYALYVPCSLKTVCAIRTRIGHIFNRQYNEILPIDRFYLGGANTVRGYDRDYCPPLGLLTKPIPAPHVGLPPAADDLWRYVPQGGRTMVNCNFEFRFPIYYELQGAIFADTGLLVKDSMMQDAPDNMLGGAGFGFRYNTPIGPIRFDLAFKLDRKYPEFESPYVWYLTLGQAF